MCGRGGGSGRAGVAVLRVCATAEVVAGIGKAQKAKRELAPAACDVTKVIDTAGPHTTHTHMHSHTLKHSHTHSQCYQCSVLSSAFMNETDFYCLCKSHSECVCEYLCVCMCVCVCVCI